MYYVEQALRVEQAFTEAGNSSLKEDNHLQRESLFQTLLKSFTES